MLNRSAPGQAWTRLHGVRKLWTIPLVLSLTATSGCQWAGNYYDSLKGEGFPEWSESMGAARGGNPNAKPSGFFTDRRSEQIEKSLGGGF